MAEMKIWMVGDERVITDSISSLINQATATALLDHKKIRIAERYGKRFCTIAYAYPDGELVWTGKKQDYYYVNNPDIDVWSLTRGNYLFFKSLGYPIYNDCNEAIAQTMKGE